MVYIYITPPFQLNYFWVELMAGKNAQGLLQPRRIVSTSATLGGKVGPGGHGWRIIPVSNWLVTPIYKPFSPFGRGISLLKGLANWHDPPSSWTLC